MLTAVENSIFMVGNYVKMVIISNFRYDPIRESFSSVVDPCNNAHFLVSDILSLHFVSGRIYEI